MNKAGTSDIWFHTSNFYSFGVAYFIVAVLRI